MSCNYEYSNILHSSVYSPYQSLLQSYQHITSPSTAALSHVAILLSSNLPSLATCLPSYHDQALLLTANMTLLTTYLTIVTYPHHHHHPGWCIIPTMEERHSQLWRQIAATTMDRVEMVLVMLLLLFYPDSEWLTIHLPGKDRESVERTQEEWAAMAHRYCREQGDTRDKVGYRTRLGEIIITIARVREIVEIEELRVEL